MARWMRQSVRSGKVAGAPPPGAGSRRRLVRWPTLAPYPAGATPLSPNDGPLCCSQSIVQSRVLIQA
eukprot:7468017-Alexandrium_andersonii.AAC.1